MGCWNTYCFFCSGPLDNVYDRWKEVIEDAGIEATNELDKAAVNAVVAKRILITKKDGKYWDDAVCVGSEWPESFVSPPCYVDDYGGINFEEDESNEDLSTEDAVIVIHRGCLSLACRWLDITPEQLWNTFCNPKTRPQHIDPPHTDGKSEQIEYYDIEKRAGQDFMYGSIDIISYDNEYCQDFEPYMKKRRVKAANEKVSSSKGSLSHHKFDDYRGEVDCNWLLAAPNIFPLLPKPRYHQFPSSALPARSAMGGALHSPDLVFAMLDWIVPLRTREDLEAEMMNMEDAESPVLYESLRALLALMQVNRQYYTLITHHRQDLFFRLIWQAGWMLPACPSDWDSWERINPSLPSLAEARREHIGQAREATLINTYDWRAYLLMFVRRKDPHVKSRHRLQRMAAQFVRHVQNRHGLDRLGTLGKGTLLSPPTPYSWERETE